MPLVLKVEKREGIGKSETRKLRKEGYLPAVMYGPGEETVPIKVSMKDFHNILRETHGEATLIHLQLGRRKKWALIKDIAYHPVTGKILHADFMLLHKGELVTMKVPIVLEGEPAGAKMGGILEQLKRDLEIRALPDKLPPHISVDVSKLGLGESIHIKDIRIEDVEILEDPELPIATVLVPRKVEEVLVEEVAEEEAPAEEKEEAPKEEEKEEEGKE